MEKNCYGKLIGGVARDGGKGKGRKGMGIGSGKGSGGGRSGVSGKGKKKGDAVEVEVERVKAYIKKKGLGWKGLFEKKPEER